MGCQSSLAIGLLCLGYGFKEMAGVQGTPVLVDIAPRLAGLGVSYHHSFILSISLHDDFS